MIVVGTANACVEAFQSYWNFCLLFVSFFQVSVFVLLLSLQLFCSNSDFLVFYFHFVLARFFNLALGFRKKVCFWCLVRVVVGS